MYEVVKVLILTMPLGIFTTFGLFMFVLCTMKVRKVDAILRQLLSFYCLAASFSSFMFLTYYYFPAFFDAFDIVYFASLVFTMVLFYHLLCFAVKSSKRFNPMHYIIGGLSSMGLLVCKLLFSEFWLQNGCHILLAGALLWGIAYSLLSVIEMYDYSLKQTLALDVGDIVDKHRAFLFVAEVLLFPVVFVVFPLIGGSNPDMLISVLLMLSILLALKMNIPLTYAMIRHYTSSENEKSLFASAISYTPNASVITSPHLKVKKKEEVLANQKSELSKRVYRKYTHKHRSTGQLIELDKNVFENYFQKHKPYLNPNLTLNYLVSELESNRTYISKFINRIYGMNFNCYINQCRLRELERLLALPANKGKSTSSLIQHCGFGNYRNYLRAKKKEEER